MRTWKVVLLKDAEKQFRKLPREIKALAVDAIMDLSKAGPNLEQWNVKKLDVCEYRLRINYRYRMRYKIFKDRLVIKVFYLGHRKDAYK